SAKHYRRSNGRRQAIKASDLTLFRRRWRRLRQVDASVENIRLFGLLILRDDNRQAIVHRAFFLLIEANRALVFVFLGIANAAFVVRLPAARFHAIVVVEVFDFLRAFVAAESDEIHFALHPCTNYRSRAKW